MTSIRSYQSSSPGIRVDSLPISKEAKAVLYLVSRQIYADVEMTDAEKQLSGVDWTQIMKIARYQGVAPLLYRSMKSLPSELVEDSALRSIRSVFHRIGILIRSQVDALLQASDAFKEAGVPALFLKGPVLGMRAYGEPIWRKPGDVDVLIRRDDYNRARSVLNSLLYEVSVPTWVEEEYLNRCYEMVFKRTDIEVDLHWSLDQSAFNRLPYSVGFEEQGLWERHTYCKLNEADIPCLSVEDALYFLCTHGGKHAWKHLYMICDVAYLVHNQPGLDWERITELSEQLKSARITYLALYLAHTLLGIPLPGYIKDKIKTYATLPQLTRRIYSQIFGVRGSFSPLRYHRIRAGLLRRPSERVLYGLYLMNRKARKLSFQDDLVSE